MTLVPPTLLHLGAGSGAGVHATTACVNRRQCGGGLATSHLQPCAMQFLSWRTSKMQHAASNIQHPAPTSNIYHPSSNIQHPTFNIQQSTSNILNPKSRIQNRIRIFVSNINLSFAAGASSRKVPGLIVVACDMTRLFQLE
jgi:hypothetical protein